MTEVNNACIMKHIQMDGYVNMWYMASAHGLSYGTVQHIMVDVLQYYNVCARCVPHVLTDDNEAAEMMA
jgi:hypothetical protein